MSSRDTDAPKPPLPPHQETLVPAESEPQPEPVGGIHSDVSTDAIADIASDPTNSTVVDSEVTTPANAVDSDDATQVDTTTDAEITAAIDADAAIQASATSIAKSETSPPTDAEEEEDEEEDEEEEVAKEDSPMTLRDHLRELRKRLFYCFIIIFLGFFACYHFSQYLFEFLMTPLVNSLPEGGKKLMYKAPAEAFLGYMRVAFVCSMFATSPLSFYQIWAFIAPGLHKEEKIYLLPLAFFSAFFFVAGAAFCYYLAFPFIFDFLMSFNSSMLESRPTVDDSLSFVLRLIVAFGCIFEMPLFAFFLARIGIVTAAWMRKVRRYAILASFIVAAILSPPEVTSMLLMAVPLMLLYEFSILVAAIFGKKSPPAEPEEDADTEDSAPA